jgi:hypothetical protein
MSEVVAAKLLKLDPDHAGYNNLLSSIYAFDEKWDSEKETGTLSEIGCQVAWALLVMYRFPLYKGLPCIV